MFDVKITPTEFESCGETVRGNLVTPDDTGPFPGICKFHGLPGGADQIGGIATRLAQVGFAVLTFDFRGFRSSDGYFTLAGEIKDAQEAITHLLDSELTHDSWMGIQAASYGAAVAICTTARDSRVNAISLRAPVYDTLWFAKSPMIIPAIKQLQANGSDQVHGINDPEIVENLLDSMVEDAKQYNPMNDISKVAPCPLIIVHGTEDKGIDLAGVKQLYERAGEPKDLVVIEGADHNLSNPVAYEVTTRTITSWFEKQKPI